MTILAEGLIQSTPEVSAPQGDIDSSFQDTTLNPSQLAIIGCNRTEFEIDRLSRRLDEVNRQLLTADFSNGHRLQNERDGLEEDLATVSSDYYSSIAS